MQNSQTDISKIDNEIVPENLTIVGKDRDLDDRQAMTAAPLKAQVRRLFLWEKLFASISVGLGIMMMGVGASEYPGQSTALRQATFGDSIERQSAITGAAASTKTTPLDRRLIVANSGSTDRQTAASNTPDRVQSAQAALEDAKLALALSQADVEQADINIQTFKTEFDRHQELHRRGDIDRQKLATAKKAYDFAQHQKSYALHGLKQVKIQLAAAEIGVEKARSQSRSSSLCARLSARKSI